MERIADHPTIRNMERTGYPGRVPEFPRCPVCGDETDTLYRNAESEIVGCSECLHMYDAWEWMRDCDV